jgi:hypothetical protein
MSVPRRFHSRLLLVVFLFVSGLTLVSCDLGSNSSDELSPEEAADQISTSVEGLSEDMRTLEGGAFSTRLKAFLALQDGEVDSGEWIGQLFGRLQSILQVRDGRFDFEGSTGEYAWDADQQRWTSDGSSDDVVLRFPATETTQDNNAILTLSGYSDTQVSIEGETVYLPTAGSASLSVEGMDVFALDLSDVSYETEGERGVPVPRSFRLDVFTAPYTHSFELATNSSTNVAFSFGLRNDDQLVGRLSTNVLLTTDDYDDLEATDVEEVSGAVDIGPDLAVGYAIQVGELAAFDDPSEEQINDRIDARIVYKGEELATLRYDKAAEEIEVVYTDGSVDPASEFYDDFLEEMEAIWSDYLDEGAFDVDATLERMARIVRR